MLFRSLEVALQNEKNDAHGVSRVSLRNPGDSIAFMVHLRITRGGGEQRAEDVAPIFWGDNYFSLLPGETREVVARYRLSELAGTDAVLQVDGYNVPASQVQAAH